MGVHYDATRRRYVVRWQDGSQRRIRRFGTEAEAIAFAETVVTRERGRPTSTGLEPEPDAIANSAARLAGERGRARDGIYAYETNAGTRWRFVFRQSDGGESQPTKGKRFRSVQIGPRLIDTLREVRAERRANIDDWVFLCPTPLRGRYAGRTNEAPPSRKTVHDWHEAALVDAGLRDMPLHALRHTAAAAWLTTGHPLIFVQRQLGHRSITTTEEHYGHLELSFVRDAVAKTEASIAKASRRTRGEEGD